MKKILIVSGIGLVLAAAYQVHKVATQYDYKILSFKLRKGEGELGRMFADLRLGIYNPADLTPTLKRLSIDVQINGIQAGTIYHATPVKLKANNAVVLPLTFSVNLITLLSENIAALIKNPIGLKLEFKGSFTVAMPLGKEVSVPIRYATTTGEILSMYLQPTTT